jgi:RNase P protein component
LREALRRLQGRLRDKGDVALIARPPAATAPFAEIASEVEALCVAGGLLRDTSA